MAGIIYCQKLDKGNQLRRKYAKKTNGEAFLPHHLRSFMQQLRVRILDLAFFIDKELFRFCQ